MYIAVISVGQRLQNKWLFDTVIQPKVEILTETGYIFGPEIFVGWKDSFVRPLLAHFNRTAETGADSQ